MVLEEKSDVYKSSVTLLRELRNSEGKVIQNTLLKTQNQLHVPVYIPV